MTTATVPALPGNAFTRVVRRLGNDTQYVLVGFPLGIVTISLLMAGLGTGAGMLVTVVGLPILVATLFAARGFATLERLRAAPVLGRDLPHPSYKRPRPDAGFFRRTLVPLTDPQSWLDLLHGVLRFIPSTIAFAFVVTWWAGALGGLTSSIWDRFIPYGDGSHELPAMLGFGSGADARIFFNTLGGVFFALTLVPVIRAAALVEARFAQGLLHGVAILRNQI
jgi:hypothetical protein